MDITAISDPSQLASTGKPDPEFTQRFAAIAASMRRNLADIPSARASQQASEERVAAALPPLPSPISSSQLSLPSRSTHRIPAVMVYPLAPPPAGVRPYPLIVLYGGGGWALGSELYMVPYARALAELFRAVVLCPSYRKAPEHPAPAALEDAWDALAWVANPDVHSKWGVNLGSVGNSSSASTAPSTRTSSPLVIGGVSSGGNIALVLARLAALRGDFRVDGVWAGNPVVFGPGGEGVPRRFRDAGWWRSRETNADAPVLSTEDMRVFESLARRKLDSGEACPFEPVTSAGETRAAGEDGWRGRLAIMPRTWLFVGGSDPLRDDTVVLAKALREAGVEVQGRLYEGLPHGFWVVVPELSASRRAMGDLARAVAWLLGRNEGEWDGANAEARMAFPSTSGK